MAFLVPVSYKTVSYKKKSVYKFQLFTYKEYPCTVIYLKNYSLGVLKVDVRSEYGHYQCIVDVTENGMYDELSNNLKRIGAGNIK